MLANIKSSRGVLLRKARLPNMMRPQPTWRGENSMLNRFSTQKNHAAYL